MKKLSIKESLSGKHIMVIGATGFLGKVFLTTLLARVPDIGSVTLLIRPGRDGESATERFRKECLGSPLFARCIKRFGARFETLLTERVHVVSGDITEDELGLDAKTVTALQRDTDLIMNASGHVHFNPPLAQALATNIDGVAEVARFAKGCRGKRLIHISTCFVVGNQSGEFSEDAPLVDWNPRQRRFDHAEEIAECRRVASTLGRKESIDWAKARAEQLGWPNIYTYTKALGEQVVASLPGLQTSIVRPAIVESTLTFPEPGWNEGINTSAPLAFLGLMGQIYYPCGPGVVLDVIPVDHVANALCMIAAASLQDEAAPLYQLGSSDTNPLSMREAIELTGLFKRRYLSQPKARSKWQRIASAIETAPISWENFERFSAPRVRKIVHSAGTVIGTVQKLLPNPARKIFRPVEKGLRAVGHLSKSAEEIFSLYRPFIHDYAYRFRTDQIRTLFHRLPQAEQKHLPWNPEAIDWRRYWIDIHLAGLAQHVFPKLEAKIRAKQHPKVTTLQPTTQSKPRKQMQLPVTTQDACKRGLQTMQDFVYSKGFRTQVFGKENIPYNRNVLVVANHSSHLDMGLIKYALGPYGERIRALAAQDYFFRDGIRQFYFSNFTNLLPIDRSADLQESLRPAIEALQRGEILMMFPEGTRTTTGEMARFKRGVGYLALTAGIDVLPIYLYGTFEAIPKGKLLLPRQRDIGAIIGPVVSNQTLQQHVAGLPAARSYREAAARIAQAVKDLAPSTKMTTLGRRSKRRSLRAGS